MSLQISMKPLMVLALTAFLISAPAQAGFVMGGSGSNSGSKAPGGYSSTPRIEEPTPNYNAIESNTVPTDNSTTPMPEPVIPADVQSEVLSEPVIQKSERYPSYPENDAPPVRAFQPAPIAAPTLSSEMPKEEPHLQLKKIGNLPVTKPETRVEMMDSTPDNMPYRSGSDAMKKPVIENTPKTWNESDADIRPQNQGQTRRLSSEIKADGILSVPETRVYSNRPEIIGKVPAYNGTTPVTPEGISAQQVESSTAPETQQATPPGSFEDAVGFASDIPLALALSQIVPPNYAYSFDTGINPGYRVSWNGGKPWNVVVQEMIAPLSMHAEISGNMVVIRPGAKHGAASIPQATPSGMPAPVQKMAEAQIPAPVVQKSAPAPVIPAPPEAEKNEKAEAVPAPASSVKNEMPVLEKTTAVATAVKVEENEITENDILKPVAKQAAPQKGEGFAPPPPALKIIEPDNAQLDLPEGQPRRAQVKDPGEQVSQQTTPQLKPIQDMRKFPSIPTAETIKSPVANEIAAKVDQEQTENQPRIWEAKQGDSLKKVLSDWSSQANVELNWGAAHDYALSSNVFINGTYSNAVKILFTHGFDKGSGPAHRLSDGGGKSILVVQDNPA